MATFSTTNNIGHQPRGRHRPGKLEYGDVPPVGLLECIMPSCILYRLPISHGVTILPIRKGADSHQRAISKVKTGSGFRFAEERFAGSKCWTIRLSSRACHSDACETSPLAILLPLRALVQLGFQLPMYSTNVTYASRVSDFIPEGVGVRNVCVYADQALSTFKEGAFQWLCRQSTEQYF